MLTCVDVVATARPRITARSRAYPVARFPWTI